MGPAPRKGRGSGGAAALAVEPPGALPRFWHTWSTSARSGCEVVVSNVCERLGGMIWRRPPRPWASLEGKVCIVTGAESGIGFATSHQLVRMGAHVIIASRNTKRSMAAVEAISKSLQTDDDDASSSGRAEFMEMDLSSLKSVRSFAKKFNARGLPLHLLVCNAGVMAPPARQASSDGLELQFQVNFLSHWLLTNMLLAEQRKRRQRSQGDAHPARGGSGGSGSSTEAAFGLAELSTRVVMLSSLMHHAGQLQFRDMQSEVDYSPFLSYAFSKMLNNLTVVELQRRIDRHPIPRRSDAVVAVHPGIANTELADAYFESQCTLWTRRGMLAFLSPLVPPFVAAIRSQRATLFRPVDASADTVLFASLAPPERVAGAYVVPAAAVARHDRAAYDESVAEQMWDYATGLTGIQIDPSLS